jgi:predicted glycogen debranching enzyme
MSDGKPGPVRVLRSFAAGGPVPANDEIDPHLSQEWLVTNGLGGYASGTVLGPITRRYHGLLIAALPSPLGRLMMLHSLSERFKLAGGGIFFAGPNELAGAAHQSLLNPVEFRLEMGLPVWSYNINDCTIEKRILIPYRQNTVLITWKVLSGSGPIRLGVRPGLHYRHHDSSVDEHAEASYTVSACENRFDITSGSDLPALRISASAGSVFVHEPKSVTIEYPMEKRRGYAFSGYLWSPGYFSTDLEQGSELTLTASTESWDTIQALAPAEAFRVETERRQCLLQKSTAALQTGVGPELVLAADQFLITPAGRPEEMARERASGDEPRTVIAGYHWFTDWGRDTMISLEGLTLVTGRQDEAHRILRTFAHYVKDGLIPNLFPEGEKQGLYHTADASLWFFHAVDRYLDLTGDIALLREILPRLREIADAHLAGTRFGIHVDPGDGLLAQGQEGYQLTWMDAKVDGWVVTPRRGKAVEINALWYNALCLLSGWMEHEGDHAAASRYREHALRARESFNQRFWNPKTCYLFDVVDGEKGDDPLCRPNQLFAISLPHPVLERSRWASVLDAADRCLVTRTGLRSLAPGEPEYKRRYDGDLRSRDAAYHQGSVWGWLIGPYVDALLKTHPDRAGIGLLNGFVEHLDEACIGSISEIFDADEPHTPRGCIAQAWSVAEVLRCFAKLSAASS